MRVAVAFDHRGGVRPEQVLKRLLEDGEYRAVIDRSYRLEGIVDASRYVETQQKTGNVVLTVSGNRSS